MQVLGLAFRGRIREETATLAWISRSKVQELSGTGDQRRLDNRALVAELWDMAGGT